MRHYRVCLLKQKIIRIKRNNKKTAFDKFYLKYFLTPHAFKVDVLSCGSFNSNPFSGL
jgi:hypothetical protein